MVVSPSSVNSSIVFGGSSVRPGPVDVDPSGIGSGELAPEPRLAYDIGPAGIDDGFVPIPAIALPPYSITPHSIVGGVFGETRVVNPRSSTCFFCDSDKQKTCLSPKFVTGYNNRSFRNSYVNGAYVASITLCQIPGVS
jgi:hypothetical protein